MKRTLARLFLAAAAALVTCMAVQAQTPTVNSCVPYLECKPLTTKAVRGAVGTHLFWFVRNTIGGIDHHGFSCLNDVCNLQQFKDAANDVLTGKMTAQATWQEYMSFECDYTVWTEVAGERPICRERKVALLTQRDAWLEGVKRQLDWKVKPLTGDSTRPTYRVVDGVIAARPYGRVSVGELCDHSRPSFPSGSDRFMYVGNQGAIPAVALCARVPQ